MVSLCSLGCSGIHSLDQAGHELRDLHASASRVLELKVCTATATATATYAQQHPASLCALCLVAVFMSSFVEMFANACCPVFNWVVYLFVYLLIMKTYFGI